jgi:hypothetical protein
MFAPTRRERPIEYSILQGAEPAGPIIGNYADKGFAEFVRDEYGRLFVYAGLAPRRRDGRFNDEALKPGEFIVLPGLIYRRKGRG